jgi:flagellar export protein FliJ
MTSIMDRLTAERDRVEQQAIEMRTATMSRPDLNGQDLMALSSYEDHAARTVRQIELKKTELAKQIDKQRSLVRVAELNVKLLDRLRDRKFQEWRAESDRELDALAADSHLARLAAEKTVSRLAARE